MDPLFSQATIYVVDDSLLVIVAFKYFLLLFEYYLNWFFYSCKVRKKLLKSVT